MRAQHDDVLEEVLLVTPRIRKAYPLADDPSDALRPRPELDLHAAWRHSAPDSAA